MEVIDWILRITGLMSIIVVIISFICSREEHFSNVEIKLLGCDQREPNEDGLKYFEVFTDENPNNEYTLFRPIGCDVKYLKVYEVIWNEKKNKLENKRCIATYNDIGHDKGILLNINYSEGIPARRIVWEADYGIKGEHLFGYNGFNGVVDVTCYKYKTGFTANIRRRIGFK